MSGDTTAVLWGKLGDNQGQPEPPQVNNRIPIPLKDSIILEWIMIKCTNNYIDCIFLYNTNSKIDVLDEFDV